MSAASVSAAQPRPQSRFRPVVAEKSVIDTVWSGHPVGFCILTRGEHQFVAYYDAERRMTVAGRRLGDAEWTYNRLPSKVGWDSHNYITMVLDKTGRLHVSGNMHCDRLVYFRSEEPLDVASIKPVHRMTGDRESGVTYPQFVRDGDARLLFIYRYGSSGNGQRLVNVYDAEKQTWRRLLDTPLLDGRGHSMNAYPAGGLRRRGPDGRFHLVWVWRDTPDCRTCHDISYARSKDLVRWQNAAGKPVKLPITPDAKSVIVDPIPTRTGLINISYGLGFDQQKRPIVHYHNYDDEGKSQIYLARWEEGRWVKRQVSDWDYRWDFGGGGCIEVDLHAGAVRPLGKKHLVQSWWHKKHGNGTWKLDAETLKIVGAWQPRRYWKPPEVRKVRSAFKRLPMQVHWQSGPGCATPKGRYFLRWETLGVNRDQPRSGSLPEPGPLELYLVRQEREGE
jgi:hypothetical protein